jgi:hypothetical protein
MPRADDDNDKMWDPVNQDDDDEDMLLWGQAGGDVSSYLFLEPLILLMRDRTMRLSTLRARSKAQVLPVWTSIRMICPEKPWICNWHRLNVCRLRRNCLR